MLCMLQNIPFEFWSVWFYLFVNFATMTVAVISLHKHIAACGYRKIHRSLIIFDIPWLILIKAIVDKDPDVGVGYDGY